MQEGLGCWSGLGGGEVIPAPNRLSSPQCRALPANTLPIVRLLAVVGHIADAMLMRLLSERSLYASAFTRTTLKTCHSMPPVVTGGL